MLKSNKVYHGDCLEIIKKIDDNSIDCVITDPPYGINYNSSRQGFNSRGDVLIETGEHYFDKISGDNCLLVEWLVDAFRVLKQNSAIYIFCHWKKWGELSKAVEAVNFNIKNMIVLNKSNFGMGDLKGAYAPKHELILFAVKGRHLMNVPPRLNDIWDVKVLYSGSIRLHPNQKHESSILPAIQQSTKKNDIILDLFAGSGTTAIACLNTNRNYILIEKEEKYVDICRKRIDEWKQLFA